jgi:hypothetical protein
MEEKPKRNNFGIILLSGIILILTGYIFYDETAQMRYDLGFQDGLEQTINVIFNQAITCQPVVLQVQNQTIQLIETRCLQ